MKNRLALFATFLVVTFLIGANSWAVDPSTATQIKKPIPITSAPIQVDPRRVPDLELIGAEIWVSQGSGDGFVPHRMIYAGSQLQLYVYFRNSGVPDISLQGVTFSVVGSGWNVAGNLASSYNQVLKSGEDTRAVAPMFPSLPAGDHPLRVKIDDTNRIGEGNEQNNETAFTLRVFPTPAGGIPEADCGIQDLTPRINGYPLSWHVNGDTDMYGHGPQVWIGGQLDRTDTRIFVRGKVSMWETFPADPVDRTEFEQIFPSVLIFQAPKNCRIRKLEFAGNLKNLRPENTAGKIMGDLGGSKNWIPLHAGQVGVEPQLFQSATCLGDTVGSEVGKIGCKDITLPPLRVYLEKVTGPACVGLPVPLHNLRRGLGYGLVGVFPLSRMKGDATIGKNQVSGNLTTTLFSDRNGISITSTARIEERGGDWTTYAGSYTDDVFNAPIDAPGCYIRKVTPGSYRGGYVSGNTGSISWDDYPNDTAFPERFEPFNRQGIINQALCRRHMYGANKDGKLGCKGIEYNMDSITIDLWPQEVKVPSIPQQIVEPTIQKMEPIKQLEPSVLPSKPGPPILTPR